MMIELLAFLVFSFGFILSVMIVLTDFMTPGPMGLASMVAVVYLALAGVACIWGFVIEYREREARRLHASREHADLVEQVRSEIPKHMIKLFMKNPGKFLDVGILGDEVRVESVDRHGHRTYDIAVDDETRTAILNVVDRARRLRFSRVQCWIHSYKKVWIGFSAMSNHELLRAIK
jgi:hypothetical protein